MGDARRRAVEIADLKSRTVVADPEPFVDNGLSVEEVFNPTNVLRVAATKGAPNWVALKERPFVYGDRKHNSNHGDEQRDAVIDNQRFDVSAAVTRRLKERAEAAAANPNSVGIATGISEVQQEMVQQPTSEGSADILREDGPSVGTYIGQQADGSSTVDSN